MLNLAEHLRELELAAAKLRWRKWSIAALIAVPLAVYSCWDAAANILGRSSPALLSRVAPDDPRGFPVLLDQGLTMGPVGSAGDRAADLQAGLRAMPFSPRLLRLLATTREADGSSAESGVLLGLAGQVSRRDLITEVTLTSAAAQRGDAAAAMLHVNAALSTSTRAPDLLFPFLAQTLADETFQSLIGSYLQQRWADEFLDYAAQNAPPARVLQLIARDPAVLTEGRFGRARSELVYHLVEAGLNRQAFDLVRQLPGGSESLDLAGFTSATLDPKYSPLTWRLTNADGIYASRIGETVSIAIDPSTTGVAVQRLIQLQAGRWTLEMPMTLTDPSADFRAELGVSCLRGTSSTPLTTARSQSGQQVEDTRVDFAVTGDCEAVRIDVIVQNLDDQKSNGLVLGSPAIEPRGN